MPRTVDDRGTRGGAGLASSSPQKRFIAWWRVERRFRMRSIEQKVAEIDKALQSWIGIESYVRLATIEMLKDVLPLQEVLI
jgi:hypothetical protein